MACDAGIIPTVLGSDSQVLDYGHEVRITPTKLKRLLVVRDGGCIWPGCDRPPSFCEAHHREQHLHGGPTAHRNLDLLCTFHHHYVHEEHWTITIADDPQRTPWFHPPDGRPALKGQRRPLLRAGFPQRRPRPADGHLRT